MQFTIKDKTFDSGRLNAFQQLHVVRRLAPVTERLVASPEARATPKPSSARWPAPWASCPTPMWTTS